MSYAPTWSEDRLGFASPRISAELRAPLAACASAFAFAAVLFAYESARVHDAAVAGARAATELRLLEPTLAAVRALAADVERLRRRHEAIRAMRRSGGERADEIARLTNALPDDTALAALHVDPHAIALDGRASSLATVATMLDALGTTSAARLIAVRGTPRRGTLVFTLARDRTP